MNNEFNSQLEKCMNCKNYHNEKDDDTVFCEKIKEKCDYKPINKNYKRAGGSGSGKTRFLVKPVIININESEDK